MEKVINVVTLEDGIEYAIIEEIVHDNKKYVFLTNINDLTKLKDERYQ